ncbi:unnamed protein product [Rhizophagus irregularis]|nr:unnamed protein product [Rhizophagus irregularis]
MFKNFCIPSLDDSINAVSSMYAVTATFFRYFTQLLGSEGLVVGQLYVVRLLIKWIGDDVESPLRPPDIKCPCCS